MAKIDYSELHAPKTPSPYGHSEENSFYLQHTKEIPGRYKPYRKIRTSGSKRTVPSTNKSLKPEDSK